jgi:beta-mannosidase
LGIWDETYLEVRPVSHVERLHVYYTLAPDFSAAEITLSVETSLAEGCAWSWRLKDVEGNVVLTAEGAIAGRKLGQFVLKNPELWWPHDHGAPYLYTSEFTLSSTAGTPLQEVVSRVGFRRVRLVMNTGAWDEPSDFPKSRSVAPAQFEVNGRRIFAKGTNCVNPEIFPGEITRQRYEELLAMAVGANFNILRIWGGAIVNKEAFYELCDEMGILVWQEFPLACNDYSDEAHYLKILEQEARSIISRLRSHPCLTLWCGGNELFNSWSGMTDQSLALRLLGSLCLHLDPLTPYIPTSPMFGMGHGNYLFKWRGREVFESMARSRCTAYSEFGMPGMSPRSVIERIIPPEELFPPRLGGAWEHHHAFGAWDASPDTWLSLDTLEEYFGPAADLDELIEQSQTLQSIGYKAIYEEARRQKPYCSMALNWCYNEPWPAAANNSLIAWPAIPKPALAAVGSSCRPLCASASFSKLIWSEEEEFFAEIWILNDIFANRDGLKLRVSLVADGNKTAILEWESPCLSPDENLTGPTARHSLPRLNSDRFTVVVEVEGRPELGSEYTMLYRKI